jgi:hypothetical protein
VNALRLGIVAGFIACITYPLTAFVPLPMRMTAAVAACFGPALAVACFGLKGFDPGPAIALWYLAVTIQMSRSMRWAKDRVSPTVAEIRLPD